MRNSHLLISRCFRPRGNQRVQTGATHTRQQQQTPIEIRVASSSLVIRLWFVVGPTFEPTQWIISCQKISNQIEPNNTAKNKQKHESCVWTKSNCVRPGAMGRLEMRSSTRAIWIRYTFCTFRNSRIWLFDGVLLVTIVKRERNGAFVFASRWPISRFHFGVCLHRIICLTIITEMRCDCFFAASSLCCCRSPATDRSPMCFFFHLFSRLASTQFVDVVIVWA